MIIYTLLSLLFGISTLEACTGLVRVAENGDVVYATA